MIKMFVLHRIFMLISWDRCSAHWICEGIGSATRERISWASCNRPDQQDFINFLIALTCSFDWRESIDHGDDDVLVVGSIRNKSINTLCCEFCFLVTGYQRIKSAEYSRRNGLRSGSRADGDRHRIRGEYAKESLIVQFGLYRLLVDFRRIQLLEIYSGVYRFSYCSTETLWISLSSVWRKWGGRHERDVALRAWSWLEPMLHCVSFRTHTLFVSSTRQGKNSQRREG